MKEKKEFELWLNMAERDLQTAEKNFQIEEYHVAAFYCQQSIEKGLKSLLLFEEKEFIKTHNLLRLTNNLAIPEEIINKVKIIEPVYQKTRYPDVSEKMPFEEFEEDDIEDFLKIAEEVLEWLKARMK